MKYLILLLILIVMSGNTNEKTINNVSIDTDVSEIVIDTLSFSLSNLDYVIDLYDIKHKDIVLKQFILETGHGTSYNFRVRNNLFGLYNSKKKQYFKFSHWTKSVEGYKNLIQYKYKEGDYYKFLIDLPYAEDKNYINKLKRITYDL